MSRIMAGGKGRILNEMHTSSYLSEKDVPGASLNGRAPVVLTVPQLKRWLQCHNAFLDVETSDIVAAECGCPAGRGPYASCKHIGALCYSLEEFSRFGHLPEFLTCTDQLQQWNRPRPKKLDIIPVANLTARRSELLIKESLLSLEQHCAFLDILVPSVDKISHDHTYALPPMDEVTNMTVEVIDELEEEMSLQYPERHKD